jgi:hypothetical protein
MPIKSSNNFKKRCRAFPARCQLSFHLNIFLSQAMKEKTTDPVGPNVHKLLGRSEAATAIARSSHTSQQE